MKITTVVHDLMHFEQRFSPQVAAGDVFLNGSDLAIRTTGRNNTAGFPRISGDHALDLLRSRAPTGLCAVLKSDLRLRLVPLSEPVTNRVDKPLHGFAVLMQGGVGLCATPGVDGASPGELGQHVIALLGGEVFAHEFSFATAVESWRIEWVDALGSPIVSLVRE